jgi:hypothetical protein
VLSGVFGEVDAPVAFYKAKSGQKIVKMHLQKVGFRTLQ